jgi:hypothetical protein
MMRAAVLILLISPDVVPRTSVRIVFPKSDCSLSLRMNARAWAGSRRPAAASDVVIVALASA